MEPLTDVTLAALRQTVQHNCAISDARHARDYSLCIYLLRMREHYRWKHELPLLQQMDIEQVGNWVTEREMWWDEIEEQDYQPLSLEGQLLDPFDHVSINQRLVPHRLVYSAGIGRMGQPHFALAQLLNHRSEESLDCFDCGEELERDSVTVPAMTQGQHIFIRRDGIRRLLWEMYDDWCLHKKAGAMTAVADHFDLKNNVALDKNLEQASNEVAPLFEAHERGEVKAGVILGENYSTLTHSLAGTRGEHYLRAMRDILADTLSTWPLIVNQHSILYLEFWLASLNGLRLQFLEQSGVIALLSRGTVDERLHRLREITETEQKRWEELCFTLLNAYSKISHAERVKLDVESLVSQALPSDLPHLNN